MTNLYVKPREKNIVGLVIRQEEEENRLKELKEKSAFEMKLL